MGSRGEGIRCGEGRPGAYRSQAPEPRTSHAPLSIPVHTSRSFRVLRWVFSRGSETTVCELSLDAAAFRYELRLRDGRAPNGGFSERFRDVAKAFQRQCELEAALLNEGWTLQSYESTDEIAV